MDRSWKDLFTFSRRERGGIAVLLIILLALILLKPIIPRFFGNDDQKMEEFRRQAQAFHAELQRIDSLEKIRPPETVASEFTVSLLDSFRARPFSFDPNTISENDLRLTGISESAANNLLKYRNKGGRFSKPEDIKKIYNVDPGWSRAVVPYIVIAPAQETVEEEEGLYNEKSLDPDETNRDKAVLLPDRVTLPLFNIELNSADSADLVLCRGIGPSFARRIITYRELLGGFYDKKQLLDIYGMDSARYGGFESQMSADPTLVMKMDINTVEFKEMLRHPYFEFYIVKAIFDYKEAKKKIDSVQELRSLPEMYPELYEKLSPYLISVNE